MKDIGKVLSFRARLPPTIMRPDDQDQSQRWLEQALDLSKRLKGRGHPGTKNVERLLGDDNAAESESDDEAGEGGGGMGGGGSAADDASAEIDSGDEPEGGDHEGAVGGDHDDSQGDDEGRDASDLEADGGQGGGGESLRLRRERAVGEILNREKGR